MLIDWFTVFAQIINFLILVFLLKRFLYGPIIRAMDEREEKIALRMQAAEQKRNEAEQEVVSYREKNREIDNMRGDILAQAGEESESLRRELVKKAKEEVDDLKAGWRETIRQEKDSFLKDLRKRGGRQICTLARQALTDLTDSELEHRIIDVFIGHIEGLKGEELKKIRESIKKSTEGIVIASAFDIPANKRQSITRAIHAYIKDDIDVRYESSPELICGIELKAPGFIVGWNLRGYLNSLEDELNKALEEETAEKTL